MRGKERRHSVRASFTVEAVFLFPIFVFLLAFILSISMNWLVKIQEETADMETLSQLDTLSYFLEKDMLYDLLEQDWEKVFSDPVESD